MAMIKIEIGDIYYFGKSKSIIRIFGFIGNLIQVEFIYVPGQKRSTTVRFQHHHYIYTSDSLGKKIEKLIITWL